MNKKQVLVLIEGPIPDACCDISIRNFSKLLQNEYNFDFSSIRQINKLNIQKYDIIILFRIMSSIQNIFNLIKNKKIIYAMDDDLLNLHALGEEFKYFAPNTFFYNNISANIKLANSIILYNENIRNSVKSLNFNINILKTNILSSYVSKKELYKKQDNIIRILCANGESSRKEELNFFFQDLVDISNKYKEKVEFYFYGGKPEKINEIKNSKICFFSYNENYYDYIEMIKKEKISILLSPLIDEGSKISKSNVKLIDACISNSIGIYSDSSVYSEIIHMEHGIKISNGIDNWFDGIELAINLSNEKRNEILNNAKNLVLNNYLTEKYLIFFEEMLNGKSFS